MYNDDRKKKRRRPWFLKRINYTDYCPDEEISQVLWYVKGSTVLIKHS